MATCPECDAELEIDDDDLEEMEAGDPWDCEACGTRLRVSTTDPLEFETDDEDDEDDDEEEKKDSDEEADDDDDAADDDDGEAGGGDWDE
jgi:alpha-aminoadipate/glutamate carrier protein LysW